MPYGGDFRAWMWDAPWGRRGRFFGSGEVRIAIYRCWRKSRATATT